jgi:hypothetical protein
MLLLHTVAPMPTRAKKKKDPSTFRRKTGGQWDMALRVCKDCCHRQRRERFSAAT